MTTDRATALLPHHEALGATMTSFGGWHMPLSYSSHLAEHHAVRRAAGLFDLSHMGTVWVAGTGAADVVDHAFVGRLSAMELGQARYTVLVTPEGGIIDDLIAYRTEPERYLLVPNAANTAVVLGELHERAAGYDVTIEDATGATALVAVQGPAAEAVVVGEARDPDRVRSLRYFSAMETGLAGSSVLLARTGYTGEDGFEIILSSTEAPALWGRLLVAGEGHGLVPAGLAARDSLRLEAAMPLYGNELSRDVDPYTAGIGGVVDLGKDDFVGRDALARAKEEHAAKSPGRRRLVGLASEGRRAARSGYPVLVDGEPVGKVTSGLPSPTLGHPVALAVVDAAHVASGTAVEVDVRGRREPFSVVPRPFYRRAT